MLSQKSAELQLLGVPEESDVHNTRGSAIFVDGVCSLKNTYAFKHISRYVYSENKFRGMDF